ncbi:D-alanyl-D-alanine carboxypeptidase family protein [Halioxenophilus sp. WMMB6]|uniref:D-alanyl-D-alanine carboxypeptidase family protein n=1 Tax=Halioxenophilus sp. WMMB6 TaxID=3073815 RepID=UPI00295EDDDA|nr:D-alanyl-D-alanine carboxypeptidase family protein [Halioxenophilus sp. WMMB6]
MVFLHTPKYVCSKLFSLACVLLISQSVFSAPVIIPAPPQLAASSYILVDANTGKILVEQNSHQKLPPASLTKMMTSYIVSDEIYNDHIQPTDMVPISVKAWRMGGSKMFVREGTEVPVEELLRGVIVQSGNDASVALAEYVAGSESAFVDVMNQQAQLLGMNSTHFKNATGWPAAGHETTAYDLSLLARALINDHPAHYAIYSEHEFTYGAPGEKPITQINRNALLFRDKSVDGIKTGHTEAAGFCLVASAVRDGMRLISVVMGTKSDDARAEESQKLLSYGFRYYETANAVKAGDELVSARVWSGKQDQVGLGVKSDVALTVPRGSTEELQIQTLVDGTIKAPIEQYQPLGKVVVSLDGEVLAEQPLLALEPVAQAGFFARLWDAIKLFFLGFFSS